MDELAIGNNIRRLRKSAGRMLAAVAQSAGITKSTLSKIERGQISSPISTFIRIADALAVPVSEFFVNIADDPPYDLTRKGEGSMAMPNGSRIGYAYEALAAAMPNKTAEPFLLTTHPDDPPVEFTHDGEEFIYLLSGRLECRLGDDTFVLRPGDSLYFDPSRKHSSRVIGKRPARYLCIFIQRQRKTARQ